jgi:hypothetical protein
MSRPELAPCTVRAAKAYVAEHHRHLKKVNGGRFAVAVRVGGAIAGVGVVGNGPRVWENTGKMVITRVATNGAKNACTMILGALCRAGVALGYTEAWTYTLPEEPGTSLKAAGFEDMGLTDGGEHDRPSRPRAPAVRPEPKRRWRRILRVSKTWCAVHGRETWACPNDGKHPIGVHETHPQSISERLSNVLANAASELEIAGE